jgi:ACR3 family arsenite transporter
MGQIADTVLIFLGIPLVAGFLTRTLGERARGQEWYEAKLLPKLGPVALYGLLFTVVVLFALQGDKITSEPLDVARIALPLLAYFALMWFAGFAIARRLQLTYARTTALAFSAASNDLSSPSRSPSACSASPPGKRSPGWSARSSRCRYSSVSSTSLWLRRRLSWPPDSAVTVSPASGRRPPVTMKDGR